MNFSQSEVRHNIHNKNNDISNCLSAHVPSGIPLPKVSFLFMGVSFGDYRDSYFDYVRRTNKSDVYISNSSMCRIVKNTVFAAVLMPPNLEILNNFQTFSAFFDKNNNPIGYAAYLCNTEIGCFRKFITPIPLKGIALKNKINDIREEIQKEQPEQLNSNIDTNELPEKLGLSEVKQEDLGCFDLARNLRSNHSKKTSSKTKLVDCLVICDSDLEILELLLIYVRLVCYQIQSLTI
jgi:hypothetical protein